jgi:lipopolysaccharide export system protein LptA
MAKAESPISIEADQMSSTEETNTVLFTGDVDAKQGDLRVRSDKMTVFYTDQDTDAKEQLSTTQQVEKLICVGNVEITRTDWLGTSDNMVYFADKRQVILTGNAKAWQGQNMVVGEKIVYYMDEGRSEVVGGTAVSVGGEEEKEKKSRVKMTILQK